MAKSPCYPCKYMDGSSECDDECIFRKCFPEETDLENFKALHRFCFTKEILEKKLTEFDDANERKTWIRRRLREIDIIAEYPVLGVTGYLRDQLRELKAVEAEFSEKCSRLGLDSDSTIDKLSINSDVIAAIDEASILQPRSV